MLIRPETQSDIPAIRGVIATAFAAGPVSCENLLILPFGRSVPGGGLWHHPAFGLAA